MNIFTTVTQSIFGFNTNTHTNWVSIKLKRFNIHKLLKFFIGQRDFVFFFVITTTKIAHQWIYDVNITTLLFYLFFLSKCVCKFEMKMTRKKICKLDRFELAYRYLCKRIFSVEKECIGKALSTGFMAFWGVKWEVSRVNTPHSYSLSLHLFFLIRFLHMIIFCWSIDSSDLLRFY